jgi:hypothetical protein
MEFAMKEYDLISIGTGSATHIVDAMLQRNPNLKVAVIDKDEPGGIWIKIHLNPILITELSMTNQHNSTAGYFLMFSRTRGRVFRLVGKLLLAMSNISDLLSTIFLQRLNRITRIMNLWLKIFLPLSAISRSEF